MKSRVFVATLAVLGGLLLVTMDVAASPLTGDAAAQTTPGPTSAQVDAPSAPDAPVMVDEAASPTHFGDAKADADFRFSDTAADDPYHTMLRELVVGASSARQRTRQAPSTADDDTALNFYSREELRSRIDAIKGGVAAMFGSDGRTEQSEEARELELERRIAMRGAYDNARLSGSTGAASGFASASSGEQRKQAEDEEAARLYLIDLMFFIWDVLTHPATIAALVIVAIVRAVVFFMRFAPRARRGNRHHGKRRRSRSSKRSPQVAAPLAIQQAVAANIEAEKPKRRRRGRRRRSFFDIFRSA